MFNGLLSVRGQDQSSKENTKRKAEKRHSGFCFPKDWLVENLDVREKNSQIMMPVIVLFFPWILHRSTVSKELEKSPENTMIFQQQQ